MRIISQPALFRFAFEQIHKKHKVINEVGQFSILVLYDQNVSS
mgnify:CR=1 FL=1